MAHRITIVVATLFLLLAAGWLPAQASTSISYSVAGQTYGWCAGYGSSSAPVCATQQCTKSGGTACQQVLFCRDGWGAVAFPEGSPVGIAADCGLNNRGFAEGRALAACVVASNALCWTDSSFDARGNEQSKESKSNFDLVWYAQSLLQLNGYTKSVSDGVMGPATRDALSKFQTEIGETPTGVVDDQTVRRLLDADSGIANLARQLKRDLVDPDAAQLSGFVYATASSPAPALSFSQELMKRSETDRLTALATVLSVEGSKCSLPATSATAMPDESTGIWDIDCAEGDYTLMLSQDGGGTVVINNGKPGDKPTADTPPSSDTSTGDQPRNDEPSGDVPPPRETAPINNDNAPSDSVPSGDSAPASDSTPNSGSPHSSHSGDNGVSGDDASAAAADNQPAASDSAPPPAADDTPAEPTTDTPAPSEQNPEDSRPIDVPPALQAPDNDAPAVVRPPDTSRELTSTHPH